MVWPLNGQDGKGDMATKIDQDLLIGLDIGSSKVVVIVGEITADGQINIIGLGSHPSYGLKRGVVVNIEATIQSIQRAAEEAELMVGCHIHSAYTGIAGSHIRSMNSHGIVAVQNLEVTQADVERVLDAAKAVAIPADQKILHVLPQEFLIDNQGSIREPIGMSGVRLEAKVHMVTGAVSAIQNIIKCVRHCGLEVADIILEQLASSHAVLTEDEKNLGVCLVDIGEGTTDIAVFSQGAICHTAVIPIAGEQVTNDITVALRIPTQAAEKIKLEHGTLESSADCSATVTVPSMSERPDRTITLGSLIDVITARYEELFTLVQSELRRSGFENLIAAGIVITGGSAKIKGATQLAESVFDSPVRLGTSQNVVGLREVIADPIYATGIGLLIHSQQQRNNRGTTRALNGGVRGVLQKMKDWFQGNF